MLLLICCFCASPAQVETTGSSATEGKGSMRARNDRLQATDASRAWQARQGPAIEQRVALDGCYDSNEYVMSAMGGKDCTTVAAEGSCQLIAPIGEPQLICSCSCAPRQAADIPPQAILATTGFVVRELKTMVRGVAAKACVLGPQLLLQTGGHAGFAAVPECNQLQEHDFTSIPDQLGSYIKPNGKVGSRPSWAAQLAAHATGSSNPPPPAASSGSPAQQRAGWLGGGAGSGHPITAAVDRLRLAERNRLLRVAASGGSDGAEATTVDAAEQMLATARSLLSATGRRTSHTAASTRATGACTLNRPLITMHD